MNIDFALTMLKLKILLVTLASATASVDFNYERLDENTWWVADLGGRPDFQLAMVGGRSGNVFVAARDRLLELDSDLSLVHSVSMVPRCRRNKQHRQLVTPCSPHNNATLLALLPTATSLDTDTGRSRDRTLLNLTCGKSLKFVGFAPVVGFLIILNNKGSLRLQELQFLKFKKKIRSISESL